MSNATITPEQLAHFQRWYTPLVSDTMDRLGITGQVLDRSVQAIMGGPSLKVCGPAFPCRVVPTSEFVEIDNLLAMIDAIPRDAMVVVAADADIDAALWGGMMSARAKARGAAGAVVNGGVRDVEQIAALHFPVFGTYRCVKDIRCRGFMHSFGVPVECGGVAIHPGDIVFADANGALVIPLSRFDEVFAELQKADVEERATMDGLQRGEDARKLFDNFGRF